MQSRHFSPLHLTDSALPIMQLHSNIRFPSSPLLQAGGAPQRRAGPAAPFFPKAPGETSKTSPESPLQILLAEDLVCPGPRRETQALEDRNQMPVFKITGHDCRKFCLIKLGWRQTHPRLQILLLPMPPWAHQPGCSKHLIAQGTLSSCTLDY